MRRRHSTHGDALVAAYLRDLEGALALTDPAEREDILDGVKEHIRAALADGRPAGEVIAALGPVERTAAAAGAEAGGEALPAPRPWPGETLLLAAALAAWPFVLVLPWVTTVLGASVLGVGIRRLWRHGRQGRALHAAVVVAALAFVVGTVLLIALESPASLAPGPEETLPGVPVE